MLVQKLQTVLHMIYPPRCVSCGTFVETDFGLCGPCWRDTLFITGLCCDCCGAPLPGWATGARELCDECLSTPRPWTQGRAAFLYDSVGRSLILALKHGDREEIARPGALWLEQAVHEIAGSDSLVVPVPLHWTRLARRRFNQSVLLSSALARRLGADHCPDALLRRTATRMLDGLGKEERFSTLDRAIAVPAFRRRRVVGRRVLIVDDVMTSGATLSAASRACLDAGAQEVNVAVLARVAKRP